MNLWYVIKANKNDLKPFSFSATCKSRSFHLDIEIFAGESLNLKCWLVSHFKRFDNFCTIYVEKHVFNWLIKLEIQYGLHIICFCDFQCWKIVC